jgi:O-antigen ligase
MRAWLVGSAPTVRRNLLLVIVVGVPILILRNMNDVVNVPKLGLLLILVPPIAVLRVAELLQQRDTEALSRIGVPAAAIAVPLSIAWLFAPYKFYSLFGNYSRFTGLIPYLVVVLFGVLVADAFRGHRTMLAWAFAVAGAVVGFYGIVQFLGLDPLRWTNRGAEITGQAFSTLGNTNFSGGFLGVVLPVAAGLVVVDRARRRYSIPVLALVVVGWLVAQSQGGWAAGVAGLAVLAGFLAAERWSRARLAGVVAAALVGLAAVGAVTLTIVAPGRGPIPQTLVSRGEWWQGAIHLASHSPIVGRGPGAYAAEGTMYRTRQDALTVGSDFTDDPHSVFLAFLAAAGLLGGVGFLIAAGWLARIGLRLPDEDLVAASFFGAVVAYLVQASISIDTVALRTAFWTAAGGMVAASLPAMSKEVQRKRGGRAKVAVTPLKGRGWIAGLAVLALATSLWSVNLVISDARVATGVRLFSQGLVTEGMKEFDTAIGFRGDYRYREIYGDLLGQAALAVAASNDPSLHAHKDEFAAKTKATYAYLEHFPNANALVGYGDFLAAWAKYDPAALSEAHVVFQRAEAADPYNPQIPREAARALGG